MASIPEEPLTQAPRGAKKRSKALEKKYIKIISQIIADAHWGVGLEGPRTAETLEWWMQAPCMRIMSGSK